jgi:hypothetical protein
MKSFLLRFEEKSVQGRFAGAASCADSVDRVAISGKAITQVVAGTKTITEVKQEGLDNDPSSTSFSAFPR